MGDVVKMVKARVDEEGIDGGSGSGSGDGIDPQFVRDCLDAVAYGDGTLFAEIFRDKMLFNHSSQEWYRWIGHSWELDVGDKFAKQECEDIAELYLAEQKRVDDERSKVVGHAEREKELKARSKFIAGRIKRLRSSAGRKECLDFAATCRTSIDAYGSQFDNKPTLLPVANGVVDLETGELHPGRPGDFLIKASKVHFDPNVTSELWEQTLWEIYEDSDKIGFVQRLIGASMLGYDREHILTVFFGQGRNGKDTIFDTVSYVLGDLAGVIQPEMLLDQGRTKNSAAPSPDIMDLKGIRLAVGSETTDGARFDVGRVKLFTGGNKLKGRWPNDKYPVTFDPTHTLFLLTNHRPGAGVDYAFWKRAFLVSHPFSFVTNPIAPNEKPIDKTLKSRLLAEATGVLTWMVEGTLAYLEGGLQPPACVLEDTADYQRNEDMIGDFVESCCSISRELAVKFPGIPDDLLVDRSPDEMMTPFKEIHERFEKWFLEYRGKKIPSNRWLGDRLTERFVKKKSGTVQYGGIRVKF